MPLLPGEILNERYRIVSLLAQGEYGAVYRAWDVADRLDVAVKEYLDPSVETQKLFRAEARRLSRLSHPQIPAVRDHFALEEVGQYLVSDFVDGVDLGNLLAQYGPLPSDLIIGWLQAVCGPLAYLHEQDQLHLNVKPANVRLTPAGEVFLVDSGLPGVGIPPGNRGYASPEQEAQEGDVGPAGDIYSLGATLYTLLTDTVPPGALERQSGLKEMVPAREVNPNVEPYLSIVATRALSLRPDARYETAHDFALALERPSGRVSLATEEPRRSEPVPAGVPSRRLPTRTRKQIEQRTIWGLVGLLLVIIAVGIAVTQFDIIPTAEEEGEAATATTQSEIIAALTALAPTDTPTPDPTNLPTPTPEPILTDTGSRMIFVPGGIFRLGNDGGDPDEQPSRLVRMDPFYIDETEVTNGQYAQCAGAGACEPPDSPNATFHESYYGDSEYDDYPVIFVSWYDAQAFCEWRGARLPAEAEWERAAGFDPAQGVKLTYPWGDEFDGTRLNYCDSNCNQSDRDTAFDDGHRDTAPVGSYPAGRSPVGLYDMMGNVMEWVADWYDRRYYEKAPNANPLGPAEGDFKVLRGGSWLSGRDEIRVTQRIFYDPTVSRANIGFRCAMAVP